MNCYILYNLNIFIISFLEPLTLLNDMDIENNFFHVTLFNFLNILDELFQTIYHIDTNASSCKMRYDPFPVIELSLVSGNLFYFYFLFYNTLAFIVPFFFYQLYLFIVSSLYKYERSFFIRKFFLFILLVNFLIQKLNNIISYIYLTISFNTYHELYNHEFDIEFDLIYYVKFNLLLFFTSYFYTLFMILFPLENFQFEHGYFISFVYTLIIFYSTFIFIYFFLLLYIGLFIRFILKHLLENTHAFSL